MKKGIDDDLTYQLSGYTIIRGVFAILFGIIVLIWPGMSLLTLGVMVAIWLFVSGLVNAFSSVFMRKQYNHWVLRLILALIQFGIGAYLVQRPGLTVATFVTAISIALIVEGVVDMVIGFVDDQDDGDVRALTVVGGLLALFGGIVVWKYPVEGSLAFVWVLGLVALFRGVMAVWFGIQARDNSK